MGRMRGLASTLTLGAVLLLAAAPWGWNEGRGVSLVEAGVRQGDGASGGGPSPYGDLIRRLQDESTLESIRDRMLKIGEALERKREEQEKAEQEGGGDEDDEDELQRTIMDMASQAERVNSWARVAEQEVKAAHKMVGLRRKMALAAEERVEAERRRNRRAEQAAEKVEAEQVEMARHIEDLTREARAKSLESEMRAKAASKLLAATEGNAGDSSRRPRGRSSSLKSVAPGRQRLHSEPFSMPQVVDQGDTWASAGPAGARERREENVIRGRKVAKLIAAEARQREMLQRDSARLALDVTS